MTATIAYDRPVKNLIDQLSATGHVTHTAYRKTSVTLHHNGGRLSHEDVLRVWQVRPASAHFDADGAGAIAEFVKVNEYAWAAGNTQGNISSIHIEMQNATTAPGWTVSPTTWKAAARLAGWLFAKVIGVRPNGGNFFVHSHWCSTACAGPYITSVWSPIMAEAQAAYDYFKGVVPPVKPPVVPPVNPVGVDRAKTKAIQTAVHVSADGYLGPQTCAAVTAVKYGPGHGFPVTYIQARVGTVADGSWGPHSIAARIATIKKIQAALGGLTVDGDFGKLTQAAWERYHALNNLK